eukprot:195032-Chlamydomonas_euryale.AAC.1
MFPPFPLFPFPPFSLLACPLTVVVVVVVLVAVAAVNVVGRALLVAVLGGRRLGLLRHPRRCLLVVLSSLERDVGKARVRALPARRPSGAIRLAHLGPPKADEVVVCDLGAHVSVLVLGGRAAQLLVRARAQACVAGLGGLPILEGLWFQGFGG